LSDLIFGRGIGDGCRNWRNIWHNFVNDAHVRRNGRRGRERLNVRCGRWRLGWRRQALQKKNASESSQHGQQNSDYNFWSHVKTSRARRNKSKTGSKQPQAILNRFYWNS
jgi:hypothetical protein